MPRASVKTGSTSITDTIFVRDTSQTSAVKGLTALAYNTSGLTLYYRRDGASADVAVTLATATLGTWTSGGFVKLDDTNMPGQYEIGYPNAAIAAGAKYVTFTLRGATNMEDVSWTVELTAVDTQNASTGGINNLAAANTTYYVSAAGNDSNTGTSPNAAWLTITKVNAGTYNPGDVVAFRSGDTFTGTIALTTTNCLGTAGNPVTLTSYGVAGQATINGGTSSAFTSTSVGGYTVNNLKLTSNVPNSAGTPAITGVVAAVFNTSGRKSGIKITNCTITGGLCGINFTSAATDATYGCTNVEIGSNTISTATEFGVYFEEAVQGTAFKHYSGVWVHDNYIHDVTGDSVGGTASGNGMVFSECDQTVVLRTIDGVGYGTVIEYNRVDNCGVSGNQPGAIYGENSNGVLIQWNNVSNQKAAGGQFSDALNIGALTSDQWLLQYNFIYNCHDGIKIDGPADGTGNFRHTIRYNLLVNNKRPDTGGIGIGSDIPGGTREISGASQYIQVYGNTFLGVDFVTPVATYGTKYQVWNNIIYNPNWLGIQYADAKLPTVVGNLYWCINSGGGRAGFYNFNTTAHTGTLAAAQTLGFEKIGGTLYGVIADPLIAWNAAILTSAPTDPRQLPLFVPALSPAVTSPAFSNGVDIVANYAISAGAYDLGGVTPSTNIGASGTARPGAASAFFKIGTNAADSPNAVIGQTQLSRLNTDYTTARAGKIDFLDVASSALLTAINNINNLSALANLFGPPVMEIPASGSIAYVFTFLVKDGEGHQLDVSGTPTITVANAAGTDRSANLSAVSHPGVGQYTFSYTVSSAHAQEGLTIKSTGAAASDASVRVAYLNASTVSVDQGAAIAAVKLQTDKLTFTGANNLQVDVQTVKGQTTTATGSVNLDTLQTNASGANTQATAAAFSAATAATQATAASTKIGTPAGASLSADVAAVKTDTAAVATMATRFNGMIALSGPNYRYTAAALALAPSGGSGNQQSLNVEFREIRTG